MCVICSTNQEYQRRNNYDSGACLLDLLDEPTGMHTYSREIIMATDGGSCETNERRLSSARRKRSVSALFFGLICPGTHLNSGSPNRCARLTDGADKMKAYWNCVIIGRQDGSHASFEQCMTIF